MIKTKKAKYTRNTKFLVGNLIICAVVLLMATAAMLTIIVTGVKNGKRERNYRNYAEELLNTSEYRTYLVFNYVVTEEPEYYKNYL